MRRVSPEEFVASVLQALENIEDDETYLECVTAIAATTLGQLQEKSPANARRIIQALCTMPQAGHA